MRDGGVIQALDGDVTQFQDTQVMLSASYSYRVMAKNSRGFASEYSAPVSASTTDCGVKVQSLASQIAYVHWNTPAATYSSVELSTSPLLPGQKSGALFPPASMSATGYTRLSSKFHDLCPGDLEADTLYYGRIWNSDGAGLESASGVFTFRTPPVPANRFVFSKDSYGLALSEEWRSLTPEKKSNALAAPYIRTMEVLQQWDETQPAGPDEFIWDAVSPMAGIIPQLNELKARGNTKSLKLVLRAGGALGGHRMPVWAADGVETVAVEDDSADKIVRWDPQYVCRYWKMIHEAGKKFDSVPEISSVAVQSVSKTGEMTMSPVMLGQLRALYSDGQIATNMQWLYRNSLLIYGESFPTKHIRMNMGRIQVPAAPNSPQEVGQAILDSLANTYGRRLTMGATGFGGYRDGLLNRYYTKTGVGVQSEIPQKDSQDPAGDLRAALDPALYGNYSSGFSFVGLHDDALAINPKLWEGRDDLVDYLNRVEARFEYLRAMP